MGRPEQVLESQQAQEALMKGLMDAGEVGYHGRRQSCRSVRTQAGQQEVERGGGGQAVGAECGEEGNCVRVGDWLYTEGLILGKVTILTAMGVKFVTFRKGSSNMEMKLAR